MRGLQVARVSIMIVSGFWYRFSPKLNVHKIISCRFLSTTNGKVKTMAEIPGPKGLPFIGTSLDYLRYRDKSHLLFFDRVNTYGQIYQEKMIAGLPRLVSICHPDDIETVLRADGKYPDRLELPLIYEIRDALKIPYGLILSSDEKWLSQCQPVSQFTMIPRKVGEYHEGFNHVGRDLVQAIKVLRNSESSVLSNIPNLLFKWSFESVGYFTLGKRLGSLDIDNTPKDCLEMIENTQVFFDAVRKSLSIPPIHKIYPTKLWKTLLNSQQKVYSIAMSFIEEKMKEVKSLEERLKHSPENEEDLLGKTDFLTHMLLKSNLKKEEITSNAVDLLFAGIETTSYTLCWCLYNLATNNDVQNALRKEINEVVGKRDIVTPEDIHSMNLLRNCIKETLRLYPLVTFNTRKLHSDVILSGYKVPAGVHVMISMLVIGRMTHNFPNEPNSFIPDRWNREGEYPKNPFAFLPFGFGPRMCVGRRIAELELHTTLAQIIRSFNVQYNDNKPMDYIMKGVMVPERQLDLVFTDVAT